MVRVNTNSSQANLCSKKFSALVLKQEFQPYSFCKHHAGSASWPFARWGS